MFRMFFHEFLNCIDIRLECLGGKVDIKRLKSGRKYLSDIQDTEVERDKDL